MMEPKSREDSVKGVEESGFYRSATAILAIIGALLGIVYTVGSILSLNLFDSEQLNANIQIIVDRSARMTASIGENTKLESMITTVDSVLQNTVSNGDNLALRDFGGDCNSDKNTDLTVDFSRNNKKTLDVHYVN